MSREIEKGRGGERREGGREGKRGTDTEGDGERKKERKK